MKILGFRSGKAWKKVIASIVYFVIVMILVIVVSYLCAKKYAASVPTSTQNKTTKTSQKAESTTSTEVTIEDIANKNGLSIGELNKTYKLDFKYKYDDGSYMMVNFENVKAIKQISNFKNVIVIENVLPFHKTREIMGTAGFISLYDEKGKQVSDLKLNATEMDNQNTGIIIYSEKEDLTKCKYLSFGPVDGANGKQILFPIQKN